MGLNLTFDYTYIRVPVLVYSRPPLSKKKNIGYCALDMLDHVGLLSRILLTGRKCIVISSKCIEIPAESKVKHVYSYSICSPLGCQTLARCVN